MQQEARPGRRWRRFRRKYGPLMLLGFGVLCILALVALLMWVLTDVNFRARP